MLAGVPLVFDECSCRFDFDEVWGYTHGYVVGETGMICNWEDVRHGSLDMPSCTKGICGGHAAVDVLPFRVKVRLLPTITCTRYTVYTGGASHEHLACDCRSSSQPTSKNLFTSDPPTN